MKNALQNSKVTEMNDIQLIGVVGAGTMGMGICEVAAANGHKVQVYDVNQAFAGQAHEALQARLKKRVLRGKITAEQAGQISRSIRVVSELDALKVCDLVVEAVIEDLAVKQQLFVKLEKLLSEEALLATNTSSISVSAIAAALDDPQRLFGLHFFNPAPVMKLVEVIAGVETNPKYIEQAVKLCRSWGKKPVRAQSSPGFIVNRVARPFYGEALKIKQEQLASVEHIDAVMTEAAGFRMGPFELMDLIGIDVNYAVSQTVYQAMFNDPRFKPSLIQSEMVHANKLGKKTGKGFYDHADGAVRPKPEYQYSEAQFDQLIVPEELTYLSVLFSEFEYDQRKWQGDLVIISGCQILMTDGQTARQHEAQSGQPTCLVDVSIDFRKAKTVNLAFGPMVNEFMQHRIIAMLNHMGKQVLVTDDQPGMIAMRTMAMLINEAADTVFNGVCGPNEVDLAMRYGVNYPKGLLALGAELGWDHVVNTLQHLQRWFGDDRYRLSPYIRNQL
ncbi:3-hydroxyacyl-CoA dehydrogenase [Marinicella sediminis]|uniref:3-hydroxyacyl-CoA dehydrogenase n=2 Tax=Marinicella sediminis TaxID=1792834 RepID=A0ABV7JFC3_9GAMM